MRTRARLADLIHPARRPVVIAVVVAISLMFCMWWNFSERRIKQFRLGSWQMLSVYDDPPLESQDHHMIACEVVVDGRPTAPKRNIMMSDIQPADLFSVERSKTGLVALIYDENVVFMHDLATGHTWPDRRGMMDDLNYLFLVKSLDQFRAEEEYLSCRNRRLSEYEREERERKLQAQ